MVEFQRATFENLSGPRRRIALAQPADKMPARDNGHRPSDRGKAFAGEFTGRRAIPDGAA